MSHIEGRSSVSKSRHSKRHYQRKKVKRPHKAPLPLHTPPQTKHLEPSATIAVAVTDPSCMRSYTNNHKPPSETGNVDLYLHPKSDEQKITNDNCCPPLVSCAPGQRIEMSSLNEEGHTETSKEKRVTLKDISSQIIIPFVSVKLENSAPTQNIAQKQLQLIKKSDSCDGKPRAVVINGPNGNHRNSSDEKPTWVKSKSRDRLAEQCQDAHKVVRHICNPFGSKHDQKQQKKLKPLQSKVEKDCTGQVDTNAGAKITAPISEEPRSTNKKTIATYFKQNFYSKDLTWQTNLVDSLTDTDTCADTDQESDLPDYDNIFEVTSGGEIEAEGSLKSVIAEHPNQSSNIGALNDVPARNQVLACATAAITANFSSGNHPSTGSNKKKDPTATTNMTDKGGGNMDSSNNNIDHVGYRRALFNYPSLSNQSGATSGKLSSTFSDAFDANTSSMSKVKLTAGKGGGGSSGGGGDRSTPPDQTPSLHVSIDNLRFMVERNLVVTLVGLYILVSLTVIVVLILPYVFNLPSSVTIDSSTSDLMAGSSYKRLQKSSHTQVDDYELFTKSSESKSTQTTLNDLKTDLLVSSNGGGDLSHTNKRYENSSQSNSGPKTNLRKKITTSTATSTTIIHDGKKDLSNDNMAKNQLLSEQADNPIMMSDSLATPHHLTSEYKQDNLITSPGSKRSTKTAEDNQPVALPILLSTKQDNTQNSRKRGSRTGGQVKSSPELPPQATAHQLRRVNGKFHDLWNVAHNTQCQPLKVPFCSRSFESMFTNSASQQARSASVASNHLLSQIPYDKTLLPNQFTQSRQSQIERALQKYEPIIDIKCYALMPLFLCSIYAPKCIQINSTQVERPQSGSTLSQATETSNIQTPVVDSLLGKLAANLAASLSSNNDDSDQQTDSRGLGAVKTSALRGTNGGVKSAPPSRQQQPIDGGQATGNNRSSDNHWARLVPPCRSLCKEAFRKCTFFFEVLSLKMLDPKECDSLPESPDPVVCLGQNEHNLLQKTADSQSCQEDKFRCTDGECIPKKWRCDGFADCTDKSDEEKCSKCNGVTQFYCGQDICINKEQVCNGIRDCRDGRDERQCLRLSNDIRSQKRIAQRQLEVWSATKELWIPFCGAHWSAMPMSHEACQALGYSRANETLILFGPVQTNTGTVTSRGLSDQKDPGQVLNTTTTKNITQANLPSADITSAESGVYGRSSKRAWFEVTSGESYTTDGETYGSANDNEQQMVGIVEDIASMEPTTMGAKSLNRAGRADHLIIYERQIPERQIISSSSSTSRSVEDLATIDAAEIKLKSLTSILYHGPQAGCTDRPAHLVSSVYLQCLNFQCGRSITSYSSRVKLQQQSNIQPVTGTVKRIHTSPMFRSNLALDSPAVNDDDDDDNDDKAELLNDQTGVPDKERTQKLEANEEFDPILLGSDSSDTDEDHELDISDDGKDSEDPINDGAENDDGRKNRDLLKVDNERKQVISEINPLISSRLVVGGIESMPGEFPYLAALHGGPDEVFFCGGVLISINWLLTAAHCVGNRSQPDGWMVKVGVTRRIASPAFVRKLSVRKIIKHPNFNHDSLFNNDIALILLEESVEFNQYLRPICLPRANYKLGPDNSKDCVVVGFGKSKFSQEANYLHVAHFVNVPIVRHSTCSSWYADHGVNLTEGMLCAGYAEGKRDACQGDSGSGLFCRHSNTNQFYVAGVVSFGIKCATPKLPGVYTSVPLYVNWIESTTRQHGYPLS